MTKDSLVTALEPHFPVVAGLIRAAASEYESFGIPIDRRPVLDGAPAGITIYHLIWNHFERYYGSSGPIRVTETDGLKVLFFQDAGVSVRVNKLDSLNLTSPLSRDGGRIYNHPQLLLSFHDEPPGQLIFGYTKRLDERGLAVLDRIMLTLENEEGVQWWTFIDGDGTAAMPEEPLPAPRPPMVLPKALPVKSKQAVGSSLAG